MANEYHKLSTGAFTQNWTNTGLITVNDNWSAVPSIIGYRGDDLTNATGVDPQTVIADGTTTPVDIIANQNNPNTLTDGGVAEFALTDPVVALQGSGTADAPFLLVHLDTSGVTNVNISYILRDIDGSVDNSIQPVALQYRVGTVFDPAQDGIDFYESVEGMLVQVNNPVAVGSTNNFGEIPVLADNGANAGTRTARGGIVIQPTDFNPERILIDDTLVANPPQVNVGDKFNGSVVGVMDYSFSNFKLFNTQALPSVISGGLQKEVTALTPNQNQLTVGTFNVENLDPNDGDTQFNNIANRIVNNLKVPDIITIEEIQDNNGATNDTVVDASQTYNKLISAIAAGGLAYTDEIGVDLDNKVLPNDPLGANSDKVDHVRLLGNNTFGFEDIAAGGDFDYNDVIVKATLAPVV